METTVRVCSQSKDLIEILKLFDKAYAMVSDYMDKYYGEKRGVESPFENDFYNRWCEVTSVVDSELTRSMLWELRESHFSSI